MRDKTWCLLAFALWACAGEAPPPEEAMDTPPESVVVDSSTSWEVSATGAGPVRIGMPLSELLALTGTDADSASLADRCDFVAVTGSPDSLLVMVDQGAVARMDIFGGTTSTVEGARVGDSEDRVKRLYPGAREGPHKYTDGSYLVVVPGAPEDTVHRIVFETDGRVVTRYRVGAFPAVEYVEGCA